MRMCPEYFKIGDFDYPRLIMGSDRFLDIFPKARPQEYTEEKHIFEVMSAAFNHGCGGFDLTIMSQNVLNAFNKFRDVHSNVVGIGGPNWRCGYMLNGKHLMDIKPRIIRTLIERFTRHEQRLITQLPLKNQKFWFHSEGNATSLSDAEIKDIYIDERIWLARLKQLSGLAKFCLFGADYADWMIRLERTDLLLWQIKTIIEYKMIPISLCHWTSLTLSKLDKLPVEGHWILANLETMYLSTKEAIATIKEVKRPITCFRILRGIKIPNEIEKVVKWLFNEVGAQSIVIGADNITQAIESFTIASNVINCIGRENNGIKL